MAKAGNYYYDQLNKEQQKAYYAMKEGLLKLQDSFAVPMLSRKELSDLLKQFDQGARAKDKRAYVSVNWPQAVLRVRFVDGIGEEQLEMEEANEGEKITD